MLIYEYVPSVETVAGYWVGNTEKVSGALCKQVYVKSTTASTVFDVILYDSHNVAIRKFTDQTGSVNDLTEVPVRGIITVEIDNATRDEGFTVKLCFVEK